MSFEAPAVVARARRGPGRARRAPRCGRRRRGRPARSSASPMRAERRPVLEVRVEARGAHERRAAPSAPSGKRRASSRNVSRACCARCSPSSASPRSNEVLRQRARASRRAATSIRYASTASCQRCSISARSPRAASSASVVASDGRHDARLRVDVGGRGARRPPPGPPRTRRTPRRAGRAAAASAIERHLIARTE